MVGFSHVDWYKVDETVQFCFKVYYFGSKEAKKTHNQLCMPEHEHPYLYNLGCLTLEKILKPH